MHCTYTSLTINKHLWRSVEMDVSHTCWYRAVPWQSVQQIAVPLCQWILVGQKWEKNYTQIPITQLQNFSFSFGFIMDSISFRSVFSDFMFILCIFFHIPHTHQLYRWGRQPAQRKKTATNVSHAVKKNRILAKALINIIYNDVSGCLAKHLSNIFFDIKF